MLQTKYTLIDEQDIPLVESYSFEVSTGTGGSRDTPPPVSPLPVSP